MGEIVPDEEQRLIQVTGKGVGEAISIVQARRMPAALAVSSPGIAGDVDLSFSDGLDLNSDWRNRLMQDCSSRFSASVNDHIGFQQICC